MGCTIAAAAIKTVKNAEMTNVTLYGLT